MAETNHRYARVLLSQVTLRATRGPKGTSRDLAKIFVEGYYGRVPYDDLCEREVGDLAAEALSFLSFATKRRAGGPILRVFNPDSKVHGWTCEHTVVEIVNDNMPFLVDSVVAALNARSLGVHLVIHPVFQVWRNRSGALGGLGHIHRVTGNWSQKGESFIHVKIHKRTDDKELVRISKDLRRVLADVRIAVGDWMAMRGKLGDVISELATSSSTSEVARENLEEACEFLTWLGEDHYTFLGYRRYHFRGRQGARNARLAAGSGLGILRDTSVRVFYPNEPKQPRKLPLLARDSTIDISKSNRRSTVHRPAHMDTITVKIGDGKGRTTGEHHFVGLFTSHAYSLSPRFIPLLRRKNERVLQRSGCNPENHDGKALLHILETYPRDELFQASESELVETALGILHLQGRQRTALFVRRDPFGRFLSCVVYTPKDVYSSALGERFATILCGGVPGTIAAFHVQIDEEPLARIHFIVKTDPARKLAFVHEELEASLATAARSWADEFRSLLVSECGEHDGMMIFQRFRNAQPTAYREASSVSQALLDTKKIQEALATGRPGLDLYRQAGTKAGHPRLRIYQPQAPLPLSDVLPMLENMGLKVMEEVPFRITPQETHPVWIHDFNLARRNLPQAESEEDFARGKALFEEAFKRLRDGSIENDGFNQLVLDEALGWREVGLIRAYSRYQRQIGVPYSQEYMIETLVKNQGFARILVDLFSARFDPDQQSASSETTIRDRCEEALEKVAVLDEDRILRRFFNLITSTLRTNFYQKGVDGEPKPYLSFKLESPRVEGLPLPRPWREIFVYSPRMEGIHLRGGSVARGGIRWSDRREDFRAEVLRLMKAQMVKNAVIVPVGAKGGFVVKNQSAQGESQALREEGIECYQTLIRGLLDITDNRNGDRVISPRDMVRHDDDDPYLVVAADKGTATFSDIANTISSDYGCWLGDAFASGGSAGYDHKKMGITAHGAWESVKRHFREMGKDIQKEDFTVVGVGDMGGDVFGNGMLQSPHICLVAAFDHRHIFLDPNPDPAASIRERKRLYETPGSTWMDFDRSVLSRGGALYKRSTKSVSPSAKVRSLFGIAENSLSPDDLIRYLLTADVDLLWFGGIGTFVKASAESHADVGGRANDGVRVDGRNLRCKVVSEGANLGLTQAGRIEYARRGGRINTDSVDNSAGVNCSDHEVNIKILLGRLVARKKLSLKARDKLLVAMTDEVAGLVLRDNYLQTGALSMAEAEAADQLPNAQRFIRALERAKRINRKVENLPDDEDIQQLANSGQGLTRPEISVLLAHAKLNLYNELLESTLPEEKFLQRDLVAYFPEPIRKKFWRQIPRHRLAREIIVTAITNQMVNRVGPTFVNDLREHTGMRPSAIARGFAIVRDTFDCNHLWDGIEELDGRVPAASQTKMSLAIKHLMYRAVIWFLCHRDHPLDIHLTIKRFHPCVAAFIDTLPDAISPLDRRTLKAGISGYAEKGVPRPLARRIASLPSVYAALDVSWVARENSGAVPDISRIYFGIGERFGFDWLRDTALGLEAQTVWQRQAVQGMVEELYLLQRQLVASIIQATPEARATDGGLSVWADTRKGLIIRTEQAIAEIQAVPAADIAILAVGVRRLHNLVEG